MKVKKLNLKEIEERFELFSNEQAIMIKGGDGDNSDDKNDKEGNEDEDVEIVD